jgi:ABC-2 type transport system ATP-binding protein
MTASKGAGPEIVLQTRGLVKTYRGNAVPSLAGVDLAIPAGELFGLLGPNGAGKTTAISIMSTILKPTAGEVRIFGLDPGRERRRVKGGLGLVPQELALYQALSARENLRFFGRLYGLTGIELRERIAEYLDFVGLADRGEQLVHTFSGGMKRRLNLAAGILHRPRLLFLDEPTVGIDAQSRNLILDRLAHLNEQGTTMIYTTHYMEEAERLCTQVAILDQGRIIAEGKPAEMIRAGNHANLQELFFSLTGRKLRD